MKKLLGVIGILALTAALLPAEGYADLRGSYAPITIGDTGFINGCEQPALRPIDEDGIMAIGIDAGRIVELWFAMSARSLAPGRETVRSIWLYLDFQQAVPNFGRGSAFAPLRHDPLANTSYFDPAWSYDGRFLAYVQTDADGANQAIYVQEFTINDGTDFDYGPGLGAEAPIGSPILVTTAANARHPNWHPSQHTLAFDSNAAGTQDIYTIDVDVVGGTAGPATRRTFSDIKAEDNASWSPNGHDIAYSTNKFGPNVLEIIDLDLSSGAPGYTRLAELNFSPVSHDNPDWSSDGGTLYYDAPDGEDSGSAARAIWTLNLATQGKCSISIDIRSDGDPDVSGVLNHTNVADGNVPYNYFLFTSQAANFGVNTWRANPINACMLPLAMGVKGIPAVMDLNDETTVKFQTIMNFPPETRAAGYRCRSANQGTIEGVRLRGSIFVSPTLMGLSLPNNPNTGTLLGGPGPCYDSTATGLADSLFIRCEWPFRTIADRVVALDLVGKIVPMKMTAYSNLVGRPFQGFTYIKLTKSSLPAPAVSLLGNSPNPFNPVTKIQFAVSKPGNYALRLFNVQGALVKTLTSRHYDAGTHEATWDGRTTGGAMAASGVYYAKMSSANKKDTSEGIKLVLAK